MLIFGQRNFLSAKVCSGGDIFLLDFFQFWLTLISILVLIVSIYRSFRVRGLSSNRSLHLIISINVMLILFLIGSFKMFYFFVIFELSIIPIFIIILGWGYQPEKLKAAYALFFFTALIASPLLIRRIYLYFQSYNLLGFNWEPIVSLRFYSSLQSAILIGGFLVKLPIYGVHLWLPLAHVEAPVYGSIILAGILLKLGGIGLLRFNSFLSNLKTSNIFIIVRLVGIILVGVTCLFLTDLKKIIAFSSVAHIGFSILFLVVKTQTSLIVGVIILLAHGFRSSGIFFMVYIFYLNSNSRNLLLNIGILSVQPLLAFFWLIIIIASLGGPPTINLLAEIWAFILRFVLLFKYTMVLIVRFMLARVYHFIIFRTMTQGDTIWESDKLNKQSSHVGVCLISLVHVIYTIFRVFVITSFFM